MGLKLTTEAYAVYIASVLHFVGQLERPPARMQETEARAISKLFPGPAKWVSAASARGFHRLGGSASLQDVWTTWKASKARVSRWEAAGTLEVASRARSLRALGLTASRATFARNAWFDSWKYDSFLLLPGVR